MVSMERKAGRGVLAALLASSALFGGPALAQPGLAPPIDGAQVICDPTVNTQCLRVNPDGSINVSGATGGGGGSSGGSTSNATDSQATTATNSPSVAYNYGFNGTSWDRLRETAGQLQVLNYGAGGLFAQGTGAAGAGSLNVFVGGGSIGNTGFNALQAGAANTSGNPFFVTVTNPSAASGSNPAAGTTGTAAPASASYTGFSSGGNLVGVSSANPLPSVLGAGTAAIGSINNTFFSAYGAVTAAAPSYTSGTSNSLSLTTAGGLRVDGSGVTQPVSGALAVSQATPGTTNAVAVKGVDQTGAQQQVATFSTGTLDVPRSSLASRVVTRTAVAANTSTTVCPAAPTIVAETLFLPISGTGLGWSGQALTTATPGTATTTPEFATAAANFTWTPLVAPTNAVTAYSGTAFTAVCVQDVRQ